MAQAPQNPGGNGNFIRHIVSDPKNVPDVTLLTGYLGGAVATHARIGDPLFSHTLFGVYLGIALWGGLWLRDARVRSLLPVGWVRGAQT